MMLLLESPQWHTECNACVCSALRRSEWVEICLIRAALRQCMRSLVQLCLYRWRYTGQAGLVFQRPKKNRIDVAEEVAERGARGSHRTAVAANEMRCGECVVSVVCVCVFGRASQVGKNHRAVPVKPTEWAAAHEPSFAA